MQIRDIKNRLPILTVLAHYNLQTNKNHLLKCPFHADKTASLQIYPATNTYHCFACGKTGDAIQFIQDKEGITKHEAILKAESFISPPTIPAPKPEKPEPTEKPFVELFGYFKESIARSANAQSYCASRGLAFPQLGETGKEVEIGYNSGEKWNKLKQCLIFPLKDKAGNIVSLYGRRITESKGYSLEYGKHYYSENRSGLYPGYPSQETQTLIITEAIIDAATLLQCLMVNDKSMSFS